MLKLTYADGVEPSSWPPSPAQLFSAAVAAAGDNPPEEIEQALRWLESQPPPAITCGEGIESSRTTYAPISQRDYVKPKMGPKWVNVTGVEVDSVSTDEVIAHYDLRARNILTIREFSIESPEVFFHYSDPPDPIQPLLDEISTVGNSHSFCTVEEVSTGPEPTLVPSGPGEGYSITLPVHDPGRAEHCREAHRAGQWPSPAREHPYRQAGVPKQVVEPGNLYRLRLGGRTFSDGITARLTQRLHRALVSLADGDVPEAFHGHGGGGMRMYPVGFDRQLTSLDLWFPGDSFADQRVRDAMRSLRKLGDIPVNLDFASTQRRPRRLWKTKTPVIWPYFPKPNRKERIFASMLERAGLPPAVSVKTIDQDLRRFELPARYARGYKIQHMEIEFISPVTGPVGIGAARAFGMGCLVPNVKGGGE